MQKAIQFYHNKGIDMLKLGCKLLNFSKHMFTQMYKLYFYPYCESDKDLCEKIREVLTGGPSIVFTQKALVDETFIRSSPNVCKLIIEVDASKLFFLNVSTYVNRAVHEIVI